MIPKISIIIPTYNSYSLMNNCLEALEQQTCKEFEVIIVDDCSTDDTYENIKKYADKSSLDINVYKLEQNSGPGVARNVGIANSVGEWIAFCDSDDWYEINFLQEVLKKVEDLNSDIVMVDYYTSYSNGQRKVNGYTKEMKEIEDKKGIIAYSKSSLCNLLIRRRLLVENQLPNLYNGEDIAVIPILLSRANNIGVVDKPLYNYYLRENSTSNRIDDSMYKSLLTAFDILKNNMSKEYEEEVEFIGVEVVLYAMSLTALKAKVDMDIVIKEVNMFINEYKNYKKNKYYKKYNLIKKIYVTCLINKLIFINRLFAYMHHKRNKN